MPPFKKRIRKPGSPPTVLAIVMPKRIGTGDAVNPPLDRPVPKRPGCTMYANIRLSYSLLSNDLPFIDQSPVEHNLTHVWKALQQPVNSHVQLLVVQSLLLEVRACSSTDQIAIFVPTVLKNCLPCRCQPVFHDPTPDSSGVAPYARSNASRAAKSCGLLEEFRPYVDLGASRPSCVKQLDDHKRVTFWRVSNYRARIV
ncbi:hypothetical protein CVT26_012284 [Gymnopilus dilepis]|uniref:Uncharacterized protein n=1 Tax=Gymnopilus dilepis TaxID=231916 RepID=A0A409YC66_9AGAR|nr:hypothetical protein CVT26_012284 [Gymnopilus dilepis]